MLGPENFGKGLATCRMLDEIEKLRPSVQQRLSESPATVEVVRDMAQPDAEFSARHGLKQRPDIQPARSDEPARLA